MARFKIISKDGKSIRYEGKPRYVGTYLKPSFLEFNEIASPTPIAWEVGDYVDYPRTGMRYYLYSIPQASKNATKNSHGKAFTYSGVQLHAATKEMEIAPFRDIVANDNNIHFSTSPDVTTFEDIYGIALRIQECMNDLYPDRWEIRVADFDDADIIEKVTTKKDFALSGGTCLDALSKIYELWQDIGWIHTYDKDLGKEVITIGYANALRGDNVSEKFLYGKGNGLTAIKKNQINKEEFATRLYVYGSERNLPPRYYGQADFPNAESADIRNLMLPLDAWGLTNGSPDPRKAYLQNDEAVAKYGVIPKTHYFDSDDAGADIYPTIKRLTIGEIRDVIASDNPYYPSSLYSDTERADIILGASNPSDDGVSNREGKRYEDAKAISLQISSPTIVIPEGSTKEISRKDVLFNVLFEHEGMGEVSVSPNMNILVQGIGIDGIIAEFELSNDITKQQELLEAKKVEAIQISESTWSVSMPKMSLKYNQREYESFRAYMVMRLIVTPISSSERTLTIIPPTTPLQVNFSRILPNTFNIKLKQIGFNIEERASQGKGKTISMKSGMCEGRGFVISSCIYDDIDDSWNLICRRQKDETLGVLFPNVDYPVQSGDEFILLDIAMPASYIHIAANRLLEEGEKLLSKASKAIYNYEPAIDATVMMESGRKLREGMFMEITDEDIVDNTTEYILIDTLNINEDESAIPAYRITLRERRKVTYKGTPSATSPLSTSSVEEESEDDNSKLLQRISELEFLKDMFYWHDEAKTIIATNHSLIVKDEMASAGTGADNDGSESVSVMNSWNDYNPNISQALGAILGVELHERLTAVEGGISEYATISFVEKAISDLIGGADGAYDTLLEIQQILQGNEASIGTILEEIGKKASKEGLAALELRVKAIEDAESEDMFTWADEEHTTIETEKNLVVKGELSDAGVAGNVNIGVTSIVVDGVTYPDSDRDGVIDLTGAFENINVNLDNYYTKTEVYNKQETYSKNEVNELVKGGESDMFAWADEAKTTIKTEKNLIVEGELSDSGVAGNVTVGISTIRIDSKDYTDTDRDGIIDLTDALKAFDFNLEDYATKAEVSVISTKVNNLVSWKEDFSKYIYIDEDDHDAHVDTNLIVSGDISDSGVGETPDAIGTVIGVEVNGVEYTDVTAGILDLSDAFNNVSVDLSDYYTIAQVDKKIDDLNVGQYATISWVESQDYIPKSGGELKDNAALILRSYSTRTLTITGNSITADMSQDPGGWAGAFASVKDPTGTITTMLGWFGGTSGLTHIFMGGTYSDPAMKMTKAGDFVFRNVPTAGGYTLATSKDLMSKQDKISDLATIRNNASDGATAYKWGNHADAGYAKASSVASKTAFEALKNEFDALESALNDDVSGKINTWNEIVDFLDEYSGSQDLETILVGINADIAKRALQSDLDSLSSSVGNIQNTVKGHTSSIGSNASAIGVLQGFFTDGVANQASKVTNALAIVFNGTTYEFDGSAAKNITFSATNLVSALGTTPVNRATADASGNTITSFYTPIATHNALVTKVSAAETNITNLTNNKADKATTLAGYGITDAYTKDEVDGKVTTINNSITTVSDRLAVVETWKNTLSEYIYVKDGIVHVTTDIIIGGDIATVAAGEDGGGYANIGIIVGNSLAEYPNTAGVITLSKELITSGIGLGELAFMDSLTKSDVGLGNVTNLAASGYLTALSSNTTNVVSVTVGGTTKNITAATMKTSLGLGSLAYKSSLVASDIPDISGTYLPLIGGTLSGELIISPINVSGKQNGLRLHDRGVGTQESLYLKWTSSSYANGLTLCPNDNYSELILNNGANNTLIHSGNISSYKAGDSDKLGGINPEGYAKTGLIDSAVSINYVGYGRTNEGNPITGPMICFGVNANYFAEIQGLMSADYLYYRRHTPEGFGATKTIAFTDSNITGNAASATKLATARTIWGQSFNGAGNVDGYLYFGQGKAALFATKPDGTANMIFVQVNPYGDLLLGQHIAQSGYGTYIYGDSINFCYGTMGSSSFTAMAINSSGNVGIGSTSPAYPLDVHGNARSTAEFISTNGKGIGFRTVNGGYGVFFQNGGSNCYLLTTAQNDAYGSYNSLRPFAFNLSTGAVTLGEKTTVSKLLTASGGVTIPSGQKLTIGSATLEWGSTYSSIDISNLVQFNGGIYIPTGKGLFIGSPSDGITLEYTGYGATLDGNLVPSINYYYNIGADNRCYKTVMANNFFSGSVSNNLWLICGENSNSTAIVFARASTSTDSKVEMGRIDGYGLTIEGDAIIKGDQATGSDIRFKNIIEDKVLDIKRIAEAPLFTFKWNDREDNTVHLGSSAQYWENVCPWLVNGEDFKTLNYATLGVAMGISLAKKTVNHEERIKELERKVESLETENRRLRYGN